MFKGAYLVAILGAIVLGGAFFYRHVQHKNTETVLPEYAVGLFGFYKQAFGKTYSSPQEEAYRLQVFYRAYTKVMTHNLKQNISYTLGLNHFSDLTKEEAKAKYLGYKPSVNHDIKYGIDYSSRPRNTSSNDDSVDWRNTPGVVSPVKNQESCGSCWAFSATGALEGHAAIKGGMPNQSFSEQQLVDCSWKYGNEGCNGGLMNQAFQYVIDNSIETENQYPYTAKNGKCQSRTGVYSIGGFNNTAPRSAGGLAHDASFQPISVAIEADKIMNYKGGIFDDISCGDKLNHGVLLVGYTKEYWLVKNSWGSLWGEQGYIRLSRTAVPDPKGGICGILLAASYPTV